MLESRLKGLGASERLLVAFTEVNGTDQCRGHEHRRPTRFPLDIPMFEYILRKHLGCRLIVIDNLEDYCESPRQLRQAIQELEDAAIYFDIAIVKPQTAIDEAEVQIASIGLPPDSFDELKEGLDAEFPDEEEDDDVEEELEDGGEDEQEE